MAFRPVGTGAGKLRGWRKKKTSNPAKVKFEPPFPLVLGSKIEGRIGPPDRTPCVGELIEMLDCLKRVGFNDGPCKSYIEAFNKCHTSHAEEERIKKELAEQDVSLIKNKRDMKNQQLDNLLKYFSPRK